MTRVLTDIVDVQSINGCTQRDKMITADLPAILEVCPFTRPAQGDVRIPGSKSITNRALLLAAISRGTTQLKQALFSDDTHCMITCLRQLGIPITQDEDKQSITITGCAGAIPKAMARLFVSNAGTAARFLTAFCALHPAGRFTFDGDTAMRRRPMQGLLQALEQLGTLFTFQQTPYQLPFTMRTQGIFGGTATINASASSQLLSALLLIAPVSQKELMIKLNGATVSQPFVAMTLAMLNEFSAKFSSPQKQAYTFQGNQQLQTSGEYAIEPDVTAASYFLALACITQGKIHLPHVHYKSLQGDTALGHVMEGLGLAITDDATGWTVQQGAIPHRDTFTTDFNAFSDTFLTLAAIAPLLPFSTTVTGIAHTRKKETDRVSAMATELRKLGQVVHETEDTLTIHPRPLRPATIHTYGDHRIAMSFAILGCHDLFRTGMPWLQIENAQCCGKTFPKFFDELHQLYLVSHS